MTTVDGNPDFDLSTDMEPVRYSGSKSHRVRTHTKGGKTIMSKLDGKVAIVTGQPVVSDVLMRNDWSD